jgi:hypothetical protein
LDLFNFGNKVISKKIPKKKNYPGLEVAEKNFFLKGK